MAPGGIAPNPNQLSCFGVYRFRTARCVTASHMRPPQTRSCRSARTRKALDCTVLTFSTSAAAVTHCAVQTRTVSGPRFRPCRFAISRTLGAAAQRAPFGPGADRGRHPPRRVKAGSTPCSRETPADHLSENLGPRRWCRPARRRDSPYLRNMSCPGWEQDASTHGAGLVCVSSLTHSMSMVDEEGRYCALAAVPVWVQTAAFSRMTRASY